MKKIHLRIVLCIMCIIGCIRFLTFDSYAESGNTISALDLSVYVDHELEERSVVVDVTTPHCYLEKKDHFDRTSKTIDLFFKAQNGYLFAITRASSIHLSGARYLSATLLNSSAGLRITVKLGIGDWVKDGNGYRYLHSDGRFTTSGWEVILGKNYYFDENGYSLEDTTTPDGHYVDIYGVCKDSDINVPIQSNVVASENPEVIEMTDEQKQNYWDESQKHISEKLQYKNITKLPRWDDSSISFIMTNRDVVVSGWCETVNDSGNQVTVYTTSFYEKDDSGNYIHRSTILH